MKRTEPWRPTTPTRFVGDEGTRYRQRTEQKSRDKSSGQRKSEAKRQDLRRKWLQQDNDDTNDCCCKVECTATRFERSKAAPDLLVADERAKQVKRRVDPGPKVSARAQSRRARPPQALEEQVLLVPDLDAVVHRVPLERV